MPANCEIRRRLRACGQSGIATCQYCGRRFCPEHGSRLNDGQEVCSRSACQGKRADLERYDEYRETVAKRNSDRLCGVEACDRQIGVQCSKCDGGFCSDHVAARTYESRRDGAAVTVRGSLCRYCTRRRKVWSKM